MTKFKTINTLQNIAVVFVDSNGGRKKFRVAERQAYKYLCEKYPQYQTFITYGYTPEKNIDNNTYAFTFELR